MFIGSVLAIVTILVALIAVLILILVLALIFVLILILVLVLFVHFIYLHSLLRSYRLSSMPGILRFILCFKYKACNQTGKYGHGNSTSGRF